MKNITSCSEGYDLLDPNGNITIKWDVTGWTGDGYVDVDHDKIFNIGTSNRLVGSSAGVGQRKRLYRPCLARRQYYVEDSLRVANCCKGGVLEAFAQDPAQALAVLQFTVGNSGNTNKTVALPHNFTLLSPGPGYTCGPAVHVPKSLFPSADGRRWTEALMTWNVTCTYSQFLAQRAPSCCVSFSAFYDDTIVPCPTCSCACLTNSTTPIITTPKTLTNSQTCVDPEIPAILNPLGTGANMPDVLYCTQDMCPVKIHWHVYINYEEYWRVKLTVTNRDFSKNFTDWNVVAQHPNFDNFTEAFSFSYKPLNPYGSYTNDTAMFWGLPYYNQMLLQAGPEGNVQSDLLFGKDAKFTLSNGWAFPSRIYFNGDDCVLPEPQSFPTLPSSSHRAGSTPVEFLVMLGIGAPALASYFF
ncbi:unnamed protein product [Sphagnum troendelagicum]|uniref:COBRA-like protein n=1 Tax=Sphagnum troendelagicum TaxID=128251 RepID=A0ABP0V0I6_9BRYO